MSKNIVKTPKFGKDGRLTDASFIKVAVVAGAVAGNRTVTGITTDDQILSVIHVAGAGSTVTNITDLTSEFSITAANTINNTGGTSSASGKLLVFWADLT